MISLLVRPTYSLAEAARLLRVSPSKLRWWLEGAVRGSRQYPPVLRSEPTGDSHVSWGEFIEAAYLCEYRRHLPLWGLGSSCSVKRQRLSARGSSSTG